jgi:CheY-like chemotaxis protein
LAELDRVVTELEQEVLVDAEMPGLTGGELLRRIRLLRTNSRANAA